MVKIFVSEVADAGNIPDGEYECIVSKTIETVSKGVQSAGSPQWELKLHVTSPAKMGTVTTQGFELRTWITFSNEASMAGMWQASIRALGFTLKDKKEFKADPKEAEGRVVKAIVKNVPDQKGITRSKIVKILKSEAQDDMGKVTF